MKTLTSFRNRQLVIAELTVKLSVNALAIAFAGLTLAQLLPYHLSQNTKLREIRLEVDRTQMRVARLRDRFGSSFALQQTETIVEDQTPLTAKDRLQIFWLNENSTARD